MASDSDTVRDILLIIVTVLFVSFALGKGGQTGDAGNDLAASIPILTPE